MLKISYQIFNVCVNANIHIFSYAKKLRKYYLRIFLKILSRKFAKFQEELEVLDH